MDRGIRTGIFFSILAFVFFSPLTLAAVQQATIVTRPGVATPPLKYYFDLSSALSEGVNQGVRVIVSASNSEKTAVRFDSVKLFGKDGATVGTNVASKTDALTANPYGFTFSNFGVAPADLANVAGVQITFMDLGGENPTGRVTVQSVAVSVTRDSGEACVIADPITIVLPPPPIPTITQIQAARPLVQPGTHGTGDSGSSGGGSGGNSLTITMASATQTNNGTIAWGSYASATQSDGSYADAPGSSTADTNTLSVLQPVGGASIPSTATINGIEVKVKLKKSGLGTGIITDKVVKIFCEAACGALSQNKARNATYEWTTSDETVTYGGPADLWGLTPSPSTFNGINGTGINLQATITMTPGMNPVVANVDAMYFVVYYTPLGGSVYDSFMDLIRVFLGKIL